MIISCVLGLHLATYHFDRNEGLNEINPGAYVSCNDFVVGTYRNSNDNQSSYVGYTIHKWNIDFLVGGIAGYENKIVPAILPSYKYKSVRFTIIPAYQPGIHISIEY